MRTDGYWMDSKVQTRIKSIYTRIQKESSHCISQDQTIKLATTFNVRTDFGQGPTVFSFNFKLNKKPQKTKNDKKRKKNTRE